MSSYISTTALAKKLGKDSRELFALLSNGGWIVKVDKRWQLTNKGRFEGGVLLEHPKCGDYVAWPEHVMNHPILIGLPAAPWTVSKLSTKLCLPARLLSMLLLDLGLVKKGPKGWLVSAVGRDCGAIQHYTEKAAIPYVCWPESILDYQPLEKAVGALGMSGHSLSGRQLNLTELQLLENWLYLQGLHYTCDRHLDVGASDFYFPNSALHLLYWPQLEGADQVANRLALIDHLQMSAANFIEVRFQQPVTAAHIDDVMPGLLLQAGIVVY